MVLFCANYSWDGKTIVRGPLALWNCVHGKTYSPPSLSPDSIIIMCSDMCWLAEKYNALVFLDECHATGFLGATGRYDISHIAMQYTVLAGLIAVIYLSSHDVSIVHTVSDTVGPRLPGFCRTGRGIIIVISPPPSALALYVLCVHTHTHLRYPCFQ